MSTLIFAFGKLSAFTEIVTNTFTPYTTYPTQRQLDGFFQYDTLCSSFSVTAPAHCISIVFNIYVLAVVITKISSVRQVLTKARTKG